MFYNRIITIACLIGGLITLLLSMSFGSVIFSAFASICFLLALMFWKYGYVIFPMLSKATNIVEIRGSYEVPSSRDYIIKKNENGYYASKFLEIKFYESAIEKGGKSENIYARSFRACNKFLKICS